MKKKQVHLPIQVPILMFFLVVIMGLGFFLIERHIHVLLAFVFALIMYIVLYFIFDNFIFMRCEYCGSRKIKWISDETDEYGYRLYTGRRCLKCGKSF